MQQAPDTYTNTVIENAMEYMDRHPDFKIADIAKYCSISESGIYSLFKRELNQTPNEVRLKILCKKAVLLLTTTDRSIQDISDALGFSSASYFRKTLKQHVGKTPSKIRKDATF